MMNDDGLLSQEEIDALLNIGDEEDELEADAATNHTSAYLSDIEIDTIGEIGNISFGSSATTLSTLLNQKVEITTPKVSIVKKEELASAIQFQPVSIQVNYVSGLSGKNIFIIKAKDASVIADIMLGGDGTKPTEQLSEIHLSAVQEAMNQMMGAAATSMSTIFNKKVDISPPSIIDDANVKLGELFDEEAYVKVFFRLTVGDLVDSNMMQLMPIDFAKQMADQLLNGENAVTETPSEQIAPTEAQQAAVKAEEPAQQAVAQQPKTEERSQNPQMIGNPLFTEDAKVEEASFSQFEPVALNQTEQRNLDMLLDIPLKITVELGRTKRAIRDILEFSAGSIIELDKLAGEPVDILVNDKLIAEGEVFVIDENFGVRVTDIISKTDRLMKLK